MRLTPGRGFIVVLIAAFVVAVALADVGARQSCGDANASRDNGMLTDAQKAYASILKEEPKSDCAKDGQTEVAEKLCTARRLSRRLAAPTTPRRSTPRPSRSSPRRRSRRLQGLGAMIVASLGRIFRTASATSSTAWRTTSRASRSGTGSCSALRRLAWCGWSQAFSR